ncbi:TlpA disulfide reductase family protein [Pontibaca salina]|uniref:TlpA family protein disulfide reductase n=1 Tax=Pontibaca salina TaxID=2795731 RepID=A0A934LZC4_9RHOB|nr:TlpA disulfide reductase family protein [Pontibaca salina]MBI6628528.1 TlpA family protein disulfide reductase [Pontibaca salina]
MNAVQVGPLVFANGRFIAIIAIMAFLLASELFARWRKSDARAIHRWALATLLGWIVGARLGFVALNLDAFVAAPLDAFAVWQGGFHLRAGALTAAAVLLIAFLRSSPSALPVALSALVASAAAGLTDLALPNGLDGRIPDITLADMTGTQVSLSNDSGEPVVLNLWATWCPPCRREMPMMMEIAAAQDNTKIIFANQGEDPATIAQFLAIANLPQDGILRDPQNALMQEFGMIGLPSTLFFAADGQLVTTHTGEISRASLLRKIADISPNPQE